MSDLLEIRFFGGVSIHRSSRPIRKFTSRKADALLAYLICNPDTHQRESLASLLWDNRSPQKAGGNLRVIITSLRQELSEYLNLDRRSPLSVKQSESLWVDVYEFGDYLADVDLNVNLVRDYLHGLQSVPPLTEVEKSNLQNALSLYNGDFLYGLNLRDAYRFDEWVSSERKKYAHLAYFAADRLASHALITGDYQDGIRWTQLMLKLDLFNEEGHRKMMVLRYLNGQRSAAIDQYDVIEGLLEDEMGVPPSPETYNLFQQIREGSLALPSPSPKSRASAKKHEPSSGQTDGRKSSEGPAPKEEDRTPLRPHIPHNLTKSLTPIFGRERQVAIVTEHLFHAERRLVSIYGLGGVGKTRLAEEVAWHSYEEAISGSVFPDGVFFIPLSAISSPEQIPFAIADAINFDLAIEIMGKGIDGLHPLIEKLRAMDLLLILDNFEHLINASDLVRELLLQVPNLTILVTSREYLGMRGEWRLELIGLTYGDMTQHDESVVRSDASLTFDEAMALPKPNPAWIAAMLNKLPPALAFFATVAAQVQSDFTITEENLLAIWSICDKVEGLPLGIELAASLVNESSCAEIAKGVASNKDMLEATMWDIPERQRTLRAVFNHSWSLLDAATQQTLPRLGIFTGSFSVEAATAIAHASADSLNKLASKSLLREAGVKESTIRQSPRLTDEENATSSVERYASHAALHQYIHEILASDAETYAQTQLRHAQYYCNKFSDYPELLASDKAADALADIAIELQNIRAAWQWAVDNQQLEVLKSLLLVLAPYYQLRGLNRQGESLFQAAVKALESTVEENSNDATEIVCLLLIELARCEQNQSKYEASIASAKQAIMLAEQIRKIGVMAKGHYQWGVTLTRLGNTKSALSHIQSAAELAQQADNVELQGHSLYQIAVINWQHGNYAAAFADSEQAIEIYKKLEYPRGIGNALILQGIVSSHQGNFEESCHAYDSALTIYREIDDLYGQTFVTNNLGRVWAERGNYAKADEYYALSLSLNEEADNPYIVSSTILSQGRDAVWRGDFKVAHALLDDAIERKIQAKDRHGETEALIYKSFLAHQEGDARLASGYANQALSIATELDDRSMQAYAYLNQGRVYHHSENFTRALECYQTAYEIREDLGQQNLLLEPLLGMAQLDYQKGQYDDALELLEPILAHVEEKSLDGLDDPMQLLYSCHLILSTASSTVDSPIEITDDASALLSHAHELLLARAETITDMQKRKSYLENIESHRMILRDFQD